MLQTGRLPAYFVLAVWTTFISYDLCFFSQFGQTQELSRSMIYLTQKGESALQLLHKSQQVKEADYLT